MAETKRTDLSAKLHVAGMSATILAMGTGFAPEAQAIPMITGPGLNVNIANTTYSLDLNGDTFFDFNLVNRNDGTYGRSDVFGFGLNQTEGIFYGYGYRKAYANYSGETVGPDNNFTFYGLKLRDTATYPPYGYGRWPEGEQRFLGFAFTVPDPQGPINGQPTAHFGFAGITLAAGTEAMTLDCYGYESEPNTGIVKSCTVPEPASLLLLAAGAVPLLAIRRRRVRH